jgi:hypothetical protein
MSDNPLKKKSEGLGDTVSKIAYIATLGHVGGPSGTTREKKKPCGGCAKRKAALNRAAQYKKKQEEQEGD